MLHLSFKADQLLISVGRDTAVSRNTQLGSFGKTTCILDDFGYLFQVLTFLVPCAFSVIELCHLQPYCPVAIIEGSAPVMKLTVCLELPECVVHPN